MNYLEDLKKSSGKLEAFICLKSELVDFTDNPTLQCMYLQLAEYLIETEPFYVCVYVADIALRAQDQTALLAFVRCHKETFQQHTDLHDVVQCLKIIDQEGL